MSENEFEKEPIDEVNTVEDAPMPSQDTKALAAPSVCAKKISLTTFILSSIALVLAAIMTTWTILGAYYQKRMRDEEIKLSVWDTDINESLALFAAIFDIYGIESVEVDSRAIINAALKEYTRQTGDDYAFYYTEEEFLELQKNNVGESQGIGINIIQSTLTLGGVEYGVIKVVNVMKGSPAQEAGLLVGDMIVFVGVGEDREPIYNMAYDVAVKRLQGSKGTVASFTVYRPNGTEYDIKEFSIERREFTNRSVDSHACTVEGYGDVGIVKIMQFDLTTPVQFCEEMDSLLDAGCTRFVFDVRHNLGGDLKSIEAVLSYFLNEGDVIIRTSDRNGTEEISRVGAVTYTDEYAGCSVSKKDIGKYREMEMVVLCNGNTASAAELFTAALRDYELATVVGTKTYGKGSMQSILSLEMFGCPGALKLTTRMYYPPKSENYDGVGIVPNVEVALSEAASKINVYDIADADDNQLVTALAQFKP